MEYDHGCGRATYATTTSAFIVCPAKGCYGEWWWDGEQEEYTAAEPTAKPRTKPVATAAIGGGWRGREGKPGSTAF